MTHRKLLKVKSGLAKIFILSFFWGLAGLLFTLNDYLSIAHFAEGIGIDAAEEYNLAGNLIASGLISAVGGLLMGASEVFYFQKRFRKLSFTKAIVLKSVFYACGLALLIFAGTVFYHTVLAGRFLFSQAAMVKVMNHMLSESFWSQMLTWSVVIIITQFILQVSDKFGRGTLLQLLAGKYHQPKTEDRIFMFLDLKSSTSIAEKLKHKKYFQFLNDFFNDAADPIIYNRGEIYQYVGDEITISWKMKNKVGCLDCFFEIKNAIDTAKDRYLQTYGTFPEFKAGVHAGEVITGEIGTIKKEIVFSGDVLNTASRLQKECNVFGKNLIISEEVFFAVKDIYNEKYIFEKIGQLQLRGKTNLNTIYSVQLNTSEESD